MAEQESKSPVRSKTLWVNAIALAGLLIQKATGTDYLDAETQVGLLAVVNLVLRVVTKKPLDLRGGAPTAWLLVLALVWPSVAGAQALPDDVCEALGEARAAYRTMQPADQGRVLHDVARRFAHEGLGLSRKTAGTRCPSPAGDIACDILQYRGTEVLYDVFVGVAQTVDCQQIVPYHGDPIGRPWVAPSDPGPGPTPAPTPTPSPVPACSDLVARLDVQASALTAILAKLDAFAPQLDQARAESHEAAVRAIEIKDTVDGVRASLDEHRAAGKAALMFVMKYIAPALGALVAGWKLGS